MGDGHDVKARLGELVRPTGQEDLMAVAYPRPRLAVTPRQALVAAGVLAAAVALWLLVTLPGSAGGGDDGAGGRGGTGETATQVAGVDGAFTTGTPVAPLSPSGSPGASGAGAAGTIVVAVVGHVERPGLVELPARSRVADALERAGVREGSDPRALNIARLLVDGEQIVVPAPGEQLPAAAAAGAGDAGAGSGVGGGAVGGSGAAAPGAAVSLNTASVEQLTELQGVGEVTAQAIVEHRESIGGFTDVNQLTDVRGIGPAKFEALRDKVTL